MIYSPASPAPGGFLWGAGEGRAGLWFYTHTHTAFVAVPPLLSGRHLLGDP